MTGAAQTIWAELIAGALADAGVATVVISPGSRSTPLVAALAKTTLELVTIIDERAAGFFALGAARATDRPVTLVCTSGSAAAHYLPALVEAATANVPLLVLTADRPPELLGCGASQTIDQVHMYGRFVRGAFDLGAPVASAGALRGARRKIIQALTLSRGPVAGPVHVEVPLRKPLEPMLPSTDDERALATEAAALRGPVVIAPPRLAANQDAIAELAAAVVEDPDGVIVVGAMPTAFADARDAMAAFAERAGYPIIAEAGSQLRTHAPNAMVVTHIDLVPMAARPTPRLVIQLGAEPVAASWPAWNAALAPAKRWVLAETWTDSSSTARVILGEPMASLAALHARLSADRSAPAHSFATDVARRPSPQRIRTSAWLDTWRGLQARAAKALDASLAAHIRSETAAVRAALSALPPHAALQIGNSLPIRVVDQVADVAPIVLTQRGAAGIDGLISSAAGATRAGRPVLLVLGDVSFTHDLGGLVAARAATAPLAVLVIDNGGGQIFAGLPVARSEVPAAAVERHWLTPPDVDPIAVATALGTRAVLAESALAVAVAVADALAQPGVTVIHAPVSASGAHDVRRTALELFA